MDNSNSQPAPIATPPSSGPTVEELSAKVAELERQNEGRLRDLQSERVKRHELEAKLNPTQPPATPQGDPVQDELGKVLRPFIAPLEKRVQVAEAIAARTLEDKAMDFLSAKTGKSRQQILDDKTLQERLQSIAGRYGFAGNVYDVTVKAHEIMDLENLRVTEAERRRVADTNANASVPAGNAPAPVVGSKEWGQEDWSDMPLHEYEQYASKGTFHEKDGKIVFTPNK